MRKWDHFVWQGKDPPMFRGTLIIPMIPNSVVAAHYSVTLNSDESLGHLRLIATFTNLHLLLPTFTQTFTVV